MKNQGGRIWGEIRASLSMYRERLVQAFDARSYEKESMALDGVAREMTNRIEALFGQRTRNAGSEGMPGSDVKYCYCIRCNVPLNNLSQIGFQPMNGLAFLGAYPLDVRTSGLTERLVR